MELGLSGLLKLKCVVLPVLVPPSTQLSQMTGERLSAMAVS